MSALSASGSPLVPARSVRTLIRPGDRLRIALVNNMPDPALAATERQFRRLVTQKRPGAQIEFRTYFLPSVPRGPTGSAYCATHSLPIDRLYATEIDALIVSGCEPGARPMWQEPYWDDFARLVDWAARNTLSTIWSCLAAHAAVLCLDGIERRRLSEKLFGVFECQGTADHPLLDSAEPSLLVPHSRLNGLAGSDLSQHGYEVLTRSKLTGPDMFVKAMPSLFVFLQGHPEYDSDSLQREFRRDMGRYLAGLRDDVPGLPCGLLDSATLTALAQFITNARADRLGISLADMPTLGASEVCPWSRSSETLYRDWLALLEERRSGNARRRDES